MAFHAGGLPAGRRGDPSASVSAMSEPVDDGLGGCHQHSMFVASDAGSVLLLGCDAIQKGTTCFPKMQESSPLTTMSSNTPACGLTGCPQSTRTSRRES